MRRSILSVLSVSFIAVACQKRDMNEGSSAQDFRPAQASVLVGKKYKFTQPFRVAQGQSSREFDMIATDDAKFKPFEKPDDPFGSLHCELVLEGEAPEGGMEADTNAIYSVAGIGNGELSGLSPVNSGVTVRTAWRAISIYNPDPLLPRSSNFRFLAKRMASKDPGAATAMDIIPEAMAKLCVESVMTWVP